MDLKVLNSSIGIAPIEIELMYLEVLQGAKLNNNKYIYKEID